MRILYIVWDQGVDYLSDTVLIGLVKNGHEVIDTNYREYLGPITDEQRANYYGRAFSIGGTLSAERKSLDRTNIEEKIKDKYFDLIIYGNPYRSFDYFDLVTSCYPKNRVVFLDGEDGGYINPFLIEHGRYFKREKTSSWYDTVPISFSMPKEKFFLNPIFEKTQFEAYITPLDKSTYIYTNEEDYYNDYRTSIYGYTMAKGGWDCMRHYEIVANGCLPFFNKYEDKPSYVMTKWPSDLQTEANYMYHNFTDDSYERAKKLTTEFTRYAYENLTCENVAKEMISKL